MEDRFDRFLQPAGRDRLGNPVRDSGNGVFILPLVQSGFGVLGRGEWSGNAPAAGGLDCSDPRYAVLVSAAAVGAELAGVDPVVDDVDADRESFRGGADADFACCVRRWWLDMVNVTDPLDGFGIEEIAVAGAQAGGGEFDDELIDDVVGSEPNDHLGGGGRGFGSPVRAAAAVR